MTFAAEVEKVLARRLPAAVESDRKRLAAAYLTGVQNHATARTTGAGPVPTTLATERAELLACVSRSMERLLAEDEIAALLRITRSAACSLRKTMLAVYDDLPVLALKSAFTGARREGRGSAGDIVDGFRVQFKTAERMEIAQGELDRQGFLWEIIESSSSRRILLIDPTFPISEAVTVEK